MFDVINRHASYLRHLRRGRTAGLLSLLATLLVAPPVFSQEDSTPKHFASVLDYVDQDIHLLAWVDISDIDSSEVAQFIADLEGKEFSEQQKLQVTAPLEGIKGGLNAAGCRRVYFMGSLAEMMSGGILLAFPCDDPELLQGFLKNFPAPLPQMQFAVDGNVLLYGAELRIKAALKKGHALSDGLQDALKDPSAELPQGIAFAPPRQFGDFLRFSLQMGAKSLPSGVMPLLESGNDLRWVMVSGKLPPREVVGTVTFTDAASAEKADEALQALLSEVKFEGSDNLLAYSRTSNRWTKRIADPAAAVVILQDIRDGGRFDANRMATSDNMKQVALALHNFADTYQQFPPQAVVDAEGKRLLSWRVLILPYLEQTALYNQFHLDEPWDSPRNLKLAEIIPAPYMAPNQKDLKPGFTRILAPLTADSAFGRPGGPLRFQDVIDGTSNTAWFVEGPTSAAVAWSKPADWEIDPKSYKEWLPGKDQTGIVSFIDGSVRPISGAVSWEVFEKLLTVSGREVVNREELNPE